MQAHLPVGWDPLRLPAAWAASPLPVIRKVRVALRKWPARTRGQLPVSYPAVSSSSPQCMQYRMSEASRRPHYGHTLDPRPCIRAW
jgi:hypothetical protein